MVPVQQTDVHAGHRECRGGATVTFVVCIIGHRLKGSAVEGAQARGRKPKRVLYNDPPGSQKANSPRAAVLTFF